MLGGMKALGLSLLLTLAGLLSLVLGLYGLGDPSALALAGMVLLAMAVMLAVLQAILAGGHVGPRRGRVG